MPTNRACSVRALAPCVVMSALFGPASPALAQWTATSLHPSAALFSDGQGAGGAQQVGSVQVGPTVGHTRASLWSGTAGSWTNLHPGTGYSIAYATDGVQQVGEVDPVGFPRAALWTGSAGSYIDLHPAPAFNSVALGVGGGQQVGYVVLGVYHASLWTGSVGSWVDLNPLPTNGYEHNSQAFATDGTQQVGYVVDVGGVISAALWSGTAASWVNLHPPGALSSYAYGVGGGRQVGMVQATGSSPTNACLWSGTAGSIVNLNPAGSTNSRAMDILGTMQVGYADVGGVRRASLWTGTAASWTDLSAVLPAAYVSSEARSISTDGGFITVVGFAYNNTFQRSEAILWKRASPPPPCPADINGDHTVNTSDLTALLVRFGQSVPPGTQGDLNNDGIVNTLDLVQLLVQFGQVCP